MARLNILYETFKINGVKRMSFSREELLYVVNQLDKGDVSEGAVFCLFESLVRILDEEQT